ncbi:hypothetical protein N7478_012555 [Penicillium angulare]|uniref:uncharacterized protein n=1 Tax=Penicillium angulare TaxID=116970 RepID=UPI002541ED5E|nr:uncharacterized protein N7478_012555 [Penicillium angulare]KAJ5259574.1 hypothetical protein N7478_012555 [Penicillium angulare]
MFAKNIEEHSNCERRKYPPTYDPPDSNEDIIGDPIAAKIFPTVRKWRTESPGEFDCSGGFCQSGEGEGPCCPILPLHERKMSAFCRQYVYGECYHFYTGQSPGYFNMELMKTLVLYGEMEPLLRACAHPDVAIKGWHNIDECGCNPVTDRAIQGYELGWNQIYLKALRTYIGLNAIYSFPETWDVASGRSEERDYRNTKLYQILVRNSIIHRVSPVVVYPHRQMLATEPPHDYKSPRFLDDESLYGRIPYHDFLLHHHLNREEFQYDPDNDDIFEVHSILRSMGLPAELSIEILDFADYSPKGRVKIPHDPFHPENRERLAKYLRYCWQLLVRCDMLIRELGMNIDWAQEVTRCMGEDLWTPKDAPRGQLIRYTYIDDYNDYRYVFK